MKLFFFELPVLGVITCSNVSTYVEYLVTLGVLIKSKGRKTKIEKLI